MQTMSNYTPKMVAKAAEIAELRRDPEYIQRLIGDAERNIADLNRRGRTRKSDMREWENHLSVLLLAKMICETNKARSV